MDATGIYDLKQRRTRLKAKVTTLANRILSPSNNVDLESLRDQLNTTFDSFSDLHVEFAEHVSTEEFSSHAKVSGKDPDQYFAEVQALYDSACSKFNELQLSAIIRSTLNDSNLAIIKANSILSATVENESYAFSIIEQCERCLSTLQSNNDSNAHDTRIGELTTILSKLSSSLNSRDNAVDMNSAPQTQDSEPNANSTDDAAVRRPGSGDGGGVVVSSLSGGQGATVNPVSSNNDVTQVAATTTQSNQSNSISVGSSATSSGPPHVTITQSTSTPVSITRSAPPPRSILHVTDLNPNSGNQGMTQSGNFVSSVVSAYDQLPNGTIHSPIPAIPVIQYNDSYAPNGRHKRIITPAPFAGDRRQWPEFRSMWLRYASSELYDDYDRVVSLKELLRGEAKQLVQSIYATQPMAYSRILSKLDDHYGDAGLCVDSVLEDLLRIRPVKDNDRSSLVSYVNSVEAAYCQLGEVGHISTITMPHVDRLADLLPMMLQRDWMKIVSNMTPDSRTKPFRQFMAFLDAERSMVIRWAEREKSHSSSRQVIQKPPPKRVVNTHYGESDSDETNSRPIDDSGKHPSVYCIIHRCKTHSLEKCQSFLGFTVAQRYDILRSHSLCFQCFGQHPKPSCTESKLCPECAKPGHHALLCRGKQEKSSTSSKSGNYSKPTGSSASYRNKEPDKDKAKQEITPKTTVSAKSNHGNLERNSSVFPIQHVKVVKGHRKATVFFDGGSNATFISNNAAKRYGARRLHEVDLDVTTLGNYSKTELTYQYILDLLTEDNTSVSIKAYGLEQITSEVEELNLKVLAELFPTINVNLLLREAGQVDILVGNDYFGLHPKNEIAKAGEHLSVLKSPFGLCLQGSHPALSNMTSHFSITAHARVRARPAQVSPNSPQHVQFARVTTCLTKSEKCALGDFVKGEELGVEVEPRCGACRCGKCPLKGQTFSFKEEQELQMIQNNLEYDKINKRFITSYPRLIDPSTLPDNFSSALATLRSTERTLAKDKQWSQIYSGQIQDMIDRKVARQLTQEEISEWKGPVYYISHLAVQNPKSESTPVRIVFNSSQLYKGVSLNSCLAKGPDSYLNNILGILLRWREEQVAVVADITKMYNSIFTREVEQHTHRFLWRNFEQRKPDVFVITRVNMGDRPAAAISSEAIKKTAELFQDEYPRVSDLLRDNSYVDDIIDSFPSRDIAETTAKERSDERRVGKECRSRWSPYH